MRQATFLLQIPVCLPKHSWWSYSNLTKQPNTPCGLLLDLSSTTSSASVHLTGGSVTTVRFYFFQVSPSENKSLTPDVRRFAPSCHGYRHCYCDDHYFLRAGLPCYHFQLVGKHSWIQYVRCEVCALVDCSQGKLFRKGPWRVLKIYIWLDPFKECLPIEDYVTTPNRLNWSMDGPNMDP